MSVKFVACEQCFRRFAVQAEAELEDMRRQTAAQKEQLDMERAEAAARLESLQAGAAEADRKAAAAALRLTEVSQPEVERPPVKARHKAL